MTKQYFKRIVSESEYRLRLLFSLNQLGMCRQDELWPFLAELELMEYMPFCEYLSELVDSGEISSLPFGNLFVTKKGQESIALFASRIPSSLRSAIIKKAPGYTKALADHKQVKAGYEPSVLSDHGCVYGQYYEDAVPILLVKMDTCREGLCQSFVMRFSEKLPLILPLLNGVPFGTDDDLSISNQAFLLAEKGHPMLIELEESKYAAVVCLQSSDTEFHIQLLFHNKNKACAWARGADDFGVQLVGQMISIFEGEL